MMKNYSFSFRRGVAGAAVMAAALLASAPASAEVLLTETFDYPVGNLYPQGNWFQTKNTVDPIQVTSTKLSYDGFLTGNSVKLGSTDLQAQDVVRCCVPRTADGTVTPVTSGDIYTAMLINVQKVENQTVFASMGSVGATMKMTDNANISGDLNKIIVVPSIEGKFKLGFDKASNTPTATTDDLDYNTTYLVVTHLKLVEGLTNDEFEAWINPTSTQTESTLKTKTESKADLGRGFVATALSQFSSKSPEMLVGPIKIATTWDELFAGNEGGDTPVEPKATLTAKASVPENFFMFQHQTYQLKVNVKAEAITDDITVGGLGSAVTPSVTTIAAADAVASGGYELTLTVNAATAQPVSETMTLTSGDVTATVPLAISVYPATKVTTTRFMANLEEYSYGYFAGNARVTYVDQPNKKLYLQDPVGAVAVGYEYANVDEAPFRAGDKITNFYVLVGEPSFGVPSYEIRPYFDPQAASGIACGTVTAQGDFQQPVEITMADLNADRATYLNRLVKVAEVEFASAGETLATGGTAVTSAGVAGRVRPFAGTDAVGVTLPATATVTGISTSASANILTVRSAADIETAPAGPASLEVERTLLVDASQYLPMGTETRFATLTVKAENMENPTSLWFGGKQSGSFNADLKEIPAGTGVYTVNITFNPTVTGRNEAMLNFDAKPTELSTSVSMAALGYDPDHLPEFSVSATEVGGFSAAPGMTDEKTLTITAANMVDYGSVRVAGQSEGAFIISSGTFLKSGNTELKITFRPKAEGSYTETLELSAPLAQPLTVTLSGTCSGTAPEQPVEGDELAFDVSAPKAQYATDFANSGASNKPLALDGWKNVALEGKRAFWSYASLDEPNNSMAKVTGYDSNAAAESKSEMLLLSPALDYKNCPNKLLEFSVMGMMLTDDMTDQFSVLYIDPTLPENERYQVIGGINIPASAEASGEWRKFYLDLDTVEVADVFFIGFHYLTTRGKNTAAQYFVDDFSWGSTSTPFMRVDKPGAVATTAVGKTVDLGEFTVTPMNLTADITLEFEGKYKDMFSLSAETLPATGGTFKVSYTPTEVGEHAVYVVLKSAGAPDTYITVGGTATEQSAIEAVAGTDATASEWFDMQGRRVAKPAKGGIYIRRAAGRTSKHAL